MGLARVRILLSEIESMGARVELAPSSRDELATLRARLGFEPPAEYAAFCTELGGITIELVRTWFFYSATATLAPTREYARELDRFRGADPDDELVSGEATAVAARRRLRS